MQSAAHRLSSGAVIDPFYSATELCPPQTPPVSSFAWIAGVREVSYYWHVQMRQDIKRACLKVGYPGCFMEPSRRASFKCAYPGGAGEFRCCGTPKASLGGAPVVLTKAEERYQFACASGELLIELESDSLPALQPYWEADWQFSRQGQSGQFEGVERFPGTELPPHLVELPRQNRPLAQDASGMFDAGCESFGTVVLKNVPRDVRLFVGECEAEAKNRDAEHFEQGLSLGADGDGILRSDVPLAFRYLTLEPSCPDARLSLEAIASPLRYEGAFACSDQVLNDIWMRAAYTLRLCANRFLLDGVKRDRLPWSGDLRVSLLANAFSFRNGDVVRRSLEVLGGAGIRDQHVNGIVDYSLWYILNHDTYQLYFKDPAFLVQEYPRIVDVMDVLALREDDRGFLGKSGGSVLIDWDDDMEKDASLQCLYAAALKAASRLAERMGDTARALCWNQRAQVLSERLVDRFFDRQAGLFIGGDTPGRYCRHANFLAVFAGIPVDTDAIAEALAGDELPKVGTPYMESLEISALNSLGRRRQALDKLRRDWKIMLDDGATTFYEAVIDPTLPDHERHAFYARPFGLSLCHAWSAGPVYLLPEILFGIRPLSDGWETYATDTFRAFDTMSACIPTPAGTIQLSAEGQTRLE